MTKTQAKSKIKEILDSLSPIKDLIDDLRIEAEETSESIEPYEGRDELTDAQQERQEWFEELTSTLQDLFDNIESAQGELEEKTY